ncbi:GHKL domain-containing protein [Ruminiclostridium cellobioparum]|uniref:Chain length determinant protein n=1 Tax=Ruminiclostridium cellobioparum subsp. termitidis CT1112 TaxID=1195236 RepID=S0FI36_RUMCE|nr:GHKL domain-containing protein [Ruminiclostridium cellobioparum]EMS71530.1 Chain length determinant protein [Ruminiclostridium cellobioparum subsp. termitidis CT1112]
MFGLLVVNTIFVLVTAYMIYFFVKKNYNIVISIKQKVLFFVLFGLLNSIISSFIMSSLPEYIQFIRPIILSFLSIAVIRYILKVNWLKSLISFCVIMLGTSVGIFFIPIIFNLVYNVDPPSSLTQNTFLYFLNNIIIYVIAFLFVRFTPFAKIVGQLKDMKPVAILLVATIALMGSQIFILQNLYKYKLIILIFSIISSIIYLSVSIIYTMQYQKSERILEEQKQQAFYNQSLSIALQDFQRFKHDQVNHLSVVYSMLEKNNVIDALNYLKETQNTTKSFTNSALFNITNAGLFGIISSKIDKAIQAGIDFNIKVIGQVGSIPNVKISELCEVVGIYLDNAIEEVIQNGKLKINMALTSTDQNVVLKISNKCGEIPTLNKSSKGINRGHGLVIANRILSAYSNILHSNIFDKATMEFTQMLTIKIGVK